MLCSVGYFYFSYAKKKAGYAMPFCFNLENAQEHSGFCRNVFKKSKSNLFSLVLISTLLQEGNRLRPHWILGSFMDMNGLF